MKKVLAIVGGILGAVVLLVLILAAMKPSEFRIERSTTIAAPPAKVFPLIDDFHRWSVWSPWEKLDPSMKKTYTGAASGKGAVYEWDGNDKVGAGRMEILEATPSSKVSVKLDFLKPFEGHNTANFAIAPEGTGSKVTWSMVGPSNFGSKVFQVFVSMDKLVGGDFERGLADMKKEAEKP